MRREASIVMLALLAACGGTTAAGVAIDASSDADDASVDGGGGDAWMFGDGFVGFEDSGDTLALAQDKCDPPCADGEFCYALVSRGGGRRNPRPLGPSDGGDASVGCHPLPPECAPTATCACLLRAVGHECQASTTDCVVDDAGRPTVECIVVRP